MPPLSQETISLKNFQFGDSNRILKLVSFEESDSESARLLLKLGKSDHIQYFQILRDHYCCETVRVSASIKEGSSSQANLLSAYALGTRLIPKPTAEWEIVDLAEQLVFEFPNGKLICNFLISTVGREAEECAKQEYSIKQLSNHELEQIDLSKTHLVLFSE